MTIPRCLLAATLSLSANAFADGGPWAFKVLLDGTPIGTHAFTPEPGAADRRVLQSRADFQVKVLGFNAYRYHHAATEHWRGDCLDSLQASTDDDGRKTVVTLKREGDSSTLTGPEGTRALAGCVMTFAYWNPRILQATQLLNPQTGRYETVRIVDLGTGSIDVRGRPVEARHYRIDGPKEPIELWYSAGGDWLGLDSRVGRRQLSYRLD